MKRIALYLATNLAILVVLSITLRLLGFEDILDEQGVGLDMSSLLLFAAVLGFELAGLLGDLLALARRHDIAVLITNQVYADPEADSERPRPLGGHTLTHWSGVVLRLERFRRGNRRATLEKHRSKAASGRCKPIADTNVLDRLDASV